MTTADIIYLKIKRSRRYVFERKDFDGVASYDQIGRALNQLINRGCLMKIGYGLYTKAKVNSLTSRLMPTNPGGTDAILREVLRMKGIDYKIDSLSVKNMMGESTQIPSSMKYTWNTKQFNRKLYVGRRELNA